MAVFFDRFFVLPGAVVDGELVDGELVDGELVDGELVDGELVDGELVDGEVADGEVVLVVGDVVMGEVVVGDVPPVVVPLVVALLPAVVADEAVATPLRPTIRPSPTSPPTVSLPILRMSALPGDLAFEAPEDAPSMITPGRDGAVTSVLEGCEGPLRERRAARPGPAGKPCADGGVPARSSLPSSRPDRGRPGRNAGSGAGRGSGRRAAWPGPRAPRHR